jgi:hypothetical protein
MIAFNVDIYEGYAAYPAVVHMFIGKTMKEAEGYFHSHMKTDSFLKGAVYNGKWKGINLTVRTHWSKP